MLQLMAVIGQLDQRITIQKPTATRDTVYGSEGVVDWTVDAQEVWASVVQTGADERFLTASDREIATRTARFRIWKQGVTVDEQRRISYDGEYWDIRGIADWGDTLELTAVATVS